jgi:Tat protein translocase TatB subunit
MFDIGMQELIVIFIVALLIFGPKRLPELGKTIGKGVAEIKKAMHGVKEQIDSEIRDIEHSSAPPNAEGGVQENKSDKGETEETKNNV